MVVQDCVDVLDSSSGDSRYLPLVDHDAENLVGLSEVVFDLMWLDTFAGSVEEQRARLGFDGDAGFGREEIKDALVEILPNRLLTRTLENETF